jgi:hypothetical protein
MYLKPRQEIHMQLRRKIDVALGEYHNGFQAQLNGYAFDFDKELAWRRGWFEADQIDQPVIESISRASGELHR